MTEPVKAYYDPVSGEPREEVTVIKFGLGLHGDMVFILRETGERMVVPKERIMIKREEET